MGVLINKLWDDFEHHRATVVDYLEVVVKDNLNVTPKSVKPGH
jgi:hypothetical protein